MIEFTLPSGNPITINTRHILSIKPAEAGGSMIRHLLSPPGRAIRVLQEYATAVAMIADARR